VAVRNKYGALKQRKIIALNFSLLKRTMYLLLIVSFPLSLCACRTSGGVENFKWAQRTIHGYHFEGRKATSPSGLVVLKETSSMEPWQRIESQHTFLQYKTLKDIEKFDNRIDYTPYKWGVKSLFSFISAKDPVDSIKQKVDVLFDKVEQILGMYGHRDKVIINLYPKSSFYEVRKRINSKNCRFRAWYIFEQNTIYINVGDVHEGILAHEIAHAIIDNYLSVRPPKNTSEILARYVDKNLYY